MQHKYEYYIEKPTGHLPTQLAELRKMGKLRLWCWQRFMAIVSDEQLSCRLFYNHAD